MLREFKQINELLFTLKSSENLWLIPFEIGLIMEIKFGDDPEVIIYSVRSQSFPKN